MNIEALQMFITIVQAGSISKAAEKLGYAQSNISTKVHNLELKLGTQLLYRTARGVTLTDSGNKLYQQAIKIVQLSDETINMLKYPQEVAGSLKIGTLQTAASTFLPKILSTYHKNYPNVELSIETGTTSASTQRVLNYQLDGAIIGGRIDERDLIIVPLLNEKLCLVTSQKNQLDLEKDPLLVFPVGCAYRKTLESWLDSQQIMIHHPIEFNYLNAIIASVSAGLGISVLPEKVAQPYIDTNVIQKVDLPKNFSSLPVSFIYRKDYVIGKALEQLLDIISSEILLKN